MKSLVTILIAISCITSSSSFAFERQNLPFNYIKIRSHYPDYRLVYIDEWERVRVNKQCRAIARGLYTDLTLPKGSFSQYSSALIDARFFELPVDSAIIYKKEAQGETAMYARYCDHCPKITVEFNYMKFNHAVTMQKISEQETPLHFEQFYSILDELSQAAENACHAAESKASQTQ
ncbi:hypothetical protein [Thalassotalea montiporae]